MEFTLTFIFGLAILAAGISLIVYHFKTAREMEREIEKIRCNNCYYRGDDDDFTPCPGCKNGSKFKDYWEGQAEDMIRNRRL